MDLSGKKFIVFGANGYIGRHLVHFLGKNGASVSASDIHPASRDAVEPYIGIDATIYSRLQSINWDVDYVFFFAGMTGTMAGFREYDRFIDVNVVGLLNILTGIKESGCRPRIVFPSTRLVYKGSDHPLKEDDEKEAKTIYACNKLTGEMLLKMYGSAFDIPFTIYRICVPYGNLFDSDYSYGTISHFLKQANDHGEIQLFGDGSLRRSFTHIEDVCRQIIHTAASPVTVNETYNLAGEDSTLSEIATLVADKYHAEIKYTEWPEAELLIESGHTVFDATKLKDKFGLELKKNFKTWLDEL